MVLVCIWLVIITVSSTLWTSEAGMGYVDITYIDLRTCSVDCTAALVMASYVTMSSAAVMTWLRSRSINTVVCLV